RLKEEMGFTTPLKEVTSFIYKAPFDNGLTEHEFDHVMLGHYENRPIINRKEVESWKWMPLETVKEDIAIQPELYTAWFKIIFDKFYKHLNTNL
ncbi:MAG: NUDIX domain-containing protein, partial [Bacteroidota bacterium]|nr:NUDIX domain-containing protein [Bacteroidota bacterium]